MLTRSQTTTFLQRICELLFFSEVMFKRLKVADDAFWRNSVCEWVKWGITHIRYTEYYNIPIKSIIQFVIT